MRAIILITAVFAAACGPVESETEASGPQSEMQLTMKRAMGELRPALASFRRLTPPGSTLFLDRLQIDGDGALVALAVESRNEGCEESAAGPGCAATAWALQWTGGVWVPFEMTPTSWEACEALGISALDAFARPYLANLSLQP